MSDCVCKECREELFTEMTKGEEIVAKYNSQLQWTMAPTPRDANTYISLPQMIDLAIEEAKLHAIKFSRKMWLGWLGEVLEADLSDKNLSNALKRILTSLNED
jgi:hypothetical protein